MLADKTRHFQLAIFVLVPDALELFHWRFVIGEFKYTAKQYRDIDTRNAGPLHQIGQDLVAEIGVGATEIEMKFKAGHDVSSNSFVLLASLDPMISRPCI